MSSGSRKLMHELTVYGYIREASVLFSINVPQELIQLCFLLYFISTDSWDTESGNALKFQFSNDNKIAIISKLQANNKAYGWRVIYGWINVKKGDIQTWKLKRCCDGDRNNGAIGIVTTDTRNICDQFLTNRKRSEAYALAISSGKLNGPNAKTHQSERYAPKILKDDIITMTFDMTGENGLLSYKYNQEDLGVAFDKIDIEKEYCLGMSLFWKGDGYEIIE